LPEGHPETHNLNGLCLVDTGPVVPYQPGRGLVAALPPVRATAAGPQKNRNKKIREKLKD